jgi:hypothetical protein
LGSSHSFVAAAAFKYLNQLHLRQPRLTFCQHFVVVVKRFKKENNKK